MCCVTATLHLPLPRTAVTAADIAAARRDARDLRFNPHRHIASAPPELLQRRSELVRRGAELRARAVPDHGERRVVFSELRHLNAQILESDPWRAAAADQRIALMEHEVATNRLALDREYFFALHTPEELSALRDNVRGVLTTTPLGGNPRLPISQS